jgi:hypothetical protein
MLHNVACILLRSTLLQATRNSITEVCLVKWLHRSTLRVPVPRLIVSANASSIAGNCGWKHYKERAVLFQSSLEHIPL